MKSFVLTVHSLLRWLILLAGALAVIRAAWGWLGELDFAQSDNLLGAGFTGLVDLNVLVGIVLLILTWGSLSMQARIHPLVMILAALAAHGARTMGRQRGDRRKHLFQGAGVLVSFVLILLGIQLVT